MNAFNPMVTILMATYNGERYISEQLESILAQSYRNIELIIADDCSTDNTYGILKQHAKKYPNIQIKGNKKQLGLVKNYEQLLKSAEGDYIAFCDQDDVWSEDKVLRAVEALQREDNTKPLMFHSDLEVTDENLKLLNPSYFKLRSYKFRDEKVLEAIVGRCGVMGNTMVINQKLKTIVLPFPEELKAHDYWVALINELYGKRLTSEETLLRYRLHHTNSSNRLQDIVGQRCSFSCLSRAKVNLPYFSSNRDKILKELLKRYELTGRDRDIVLKFIDYLEFEKNRPYLISLIFKYDFLRDDFIYRLKIALKILWKKR